MSTATVPIETIEDLISQAEAAEWQAAESRRTGEEAVRRAEEAVAAAKKAEETAAKLGADLAVLWRQAAGEQE